MEIYKACLGNSLWITGTLEEVKEDVESVMNNTDGTDYLGDVEVKYYNYEGVEIDQLPE